MRQSETVGKLLDAMSKAQSEMGHARKTATNPHFRSTYADLAEVWDAVRGPLSKHRLSVVQAPGLDEDRVTLTTRLGHASGEWLEFVSAARPKALDPQSVGSALTYLRRYSLAAAAGIAQDDDDGEAATRTETKQAARNGGGKPETPPPAEVAPRDDVATISGEQVRDLLAMVDEVAGGGKAASTLLRKALDNCGVKTPDQIPTDLWWRTLQWVEKHRKTETA